VVCWGPLRSDPAVTCCPRTRRTADHLRWHARVHPKAGQTDQAKVVGVDRCRQRSRGQSAVRIMLEPVFEANLLTCSFGFPPSARRALRSKWSATRPGEACGRSLGRTAPTVSRRSRLRVDVRHVDVVVRPAHTARWNKSDPSSETSDGFARSCPMATRDSRGFGRVAAGCRGRFGVGRRRSLCSDDVRRRRRVAAVRGADVRP
jgi:hypothetical protein